MISDISEMILDIQYRIERTICVTGILSHSTPHNMKGTIHDNNKLIVTIDHE